MNSVSLFSNQPTTGNRPLYAPIGSGTLKPGGISSLPDNVVLSLGQIEQLYTAPTADKLYETIPTDYNQYIQLYNILYNILSTSTDPTLKLLLNIVKEALQSAINAYTIYGDNLACKLDTLNLQQQVNDCLSNKNSHQVATAVGNLNVTRKFTLAPVFNYYIVLYGMPSPGEGFDPVRINFLVNLLNRVGVNPYK